MPNGTINCGDTLGTAITLPPASTLGPNDPGYVQATRGPFNGKADTCVPVSLQFTNSILIDNSFTNKWNSVSQPNAAFLYSANGKAKPLPPEQYPTVNRPKVAWEFDSTGAPINKTEGLACLGPHLPQPYGRLPAAGLGAGDGTVVLDLTNPPPPATGFAGGWAPLPTGAFAMYVDSERVTATVMSSTATSATLSLVRGQAQTSAMGHAGGAYAMGTPLPIDMRTGSVYIGKAVRMCIVSHGWQAYTDPVTGASQYYEFTDAIDNGDGWATTE